MPLIHHLHQSTFNMKLIRKATNDVIADDPNVKTFSDYLSLNKYDWIKGAIVAFLSAFLAAIYKIIDMGQFPTWQEWRTAALVGAAAFIGYIIKNFFTDSTGALAPKPAKEEENGD